MVSVGNKELEWREGLTIEMLVQETGGAPGVSFAVVNKQFVRRLDWPET